MQASVKLDYKQALKGLAGYHKAVRRATAVAINRTANTGRALMARRIKDRRKLIGGLAIADIKQDIAIQRATPYTLFARLMMFGGKHIPLSEYRHAMSRAGFSVNILGEGLKMVRDYGNKGFENPALRGGQASIRTQAKRTPTKLLRGPTLASAVTAHGWQHDVLAPQLLARFHVLLQQQLSFRLRQ